MCDYVNESIEILRFFFMSNELCDFVKKLLFGNYIKNYVCFFIFFSFIFSI